MRWPWSRRREPVRPEGQPLADGDRVLFPGQSCPISEMVTREYPQIPPRREPGTDTTRLIRPYVGQPRRASWWSR